MKYEKGYVEPEKMTVEEYLDDWVENYIKENRKINTYNRYRGLIDRNIIPNIGSILLKDLRPIHVETMFLEEKKKGISNSSLENIYVVINSALMY